MLSKQGRRLARISEINFWRNQLSVLEGCCAEARLPFLARTHSIEHNQHVHTMRTRSPPSHAVTTKILPAPGSAATHFAGQTSRHRAVVRASSMRTFISRTTHGPRTRRTIRNFVMVITYERYIVSASTGDRQRPASPGESFSK